MANADSDDLSLVRNHRTGKFHQAIRYPVPGQAVSVVAGDFNEDGAPDLAVVVLGGLVQVLINTGAH